MTKSSKLMHLLRLTWSSPVFGDAYPAEVATHAGDVLAQVESLHRRFVGRLKPILTRGMPLAGPAEVEAIVQQIAPKSTAFCGAIAAGEVEDVERLASAAVSIALVYWADQSMDRGDEAMLSAVRMLRSGTNGKGVTDPLSAMIKARLGALRWIEREVAVISRPEDASFLLRLVYTDTLQNEATMRELSRRYVMEGGGSEFWDAHTDRIAELSIIDGALIYVTAAIYAIYRQHRPHLPSLAEVFNQPEVVAVMSGPCNAAIRIFDDLGDRLIDGGHYPEWGVFNLNIFNQPKPDLVRAFMSRAGMDDERVRAAVLEAFQSGNRVGRAYVAQVFVNLVRDRLAAVSPEVWERYGAFLTLGKRVVDAGYVNTMGDIELAGTQPIEMAEAA